MNATQLAAAPLRFLALVLLAHATGVAQTHAWQDPSGHQVQFVTVEKDVRLEVLDWGGTGRPVVLLGGYTTAHMFDEIAPKLLPAGHVYGITRRGLGASSKPDHGYTARESGEDVLHVLDALKLEKPVVMGYSFGGQDLSVLGAEHSERIGALVYLDSAEDERVWPFPNGPISADEKEWKAHLPKIPPPDRTSIAAYRAWQKTAHNMAVPESELRQLHAINSDGSVGDYLVTKDVRDAMFAGRVYPDYERIRIPVLSFFEMPVPLSEQLSKYQTLSIEQAAALGAQYAMSQMWTAVNSHALRRALPAAKIVYLVGGNNYIFLTNEAEVVRETVAFVEGLK
ncbi:MAG TPA: alpha/beta hydrolase [Bryobacteraceae bacterium]|jgi:non-heme chloroperoxidase|nr:alpha/beta hydrolase [Bryobacteraceae bacterium]